MRKTLYLCLALVIAVTTSLTAQTQQEVVDAIVKEATENSQLEKLAYKLTDFIGPRLVGTPQMQHAHDWAVEQFNEWVLKRKISSMANGTAGCVELLISIWSRRG